MASPDRSVAVPVPTRPPRAIASPSRAAATPANTQTTGTSGMTYRKNTVTAAESAKTPPRRPQVHPMPRRLARSHHHPGDSRHEDEQAASVWKRAGQVRIPARPDVDAVRGRQVREVVAQVRHERRRIEDQYGVPATNPAAAAMTKTTEGVQAAGESGLRKRSSRITCAADMAMTTAAALYLVDVASPPRSPATAKPPSVGRLTGGAVACVSAGPRAARGKA